ncbi:MAG: GH36-type glycosyl hydrolase domain-containing protein [Gemmatimonadaceae bacterium]
MRSVRRATPSADDLLAGPLRGELLGAEHLAERAREIARAQRIARPRRGRPPARLLLRLSSTRRILEDAYARLTAASARGADVGPAAEWLLDNYHVIQEHVREVHESLPRQYYRELPTLANGSLAGYPRVYELAITLISHSEGRVDLDNVDLFVAAFQEIVPLSIGELWAVPAMLRLGLIESVRRMALRTVQRLDEVEEADRWVERILRANEASSESLGTALREFLDAPIALTPVFVSRFLHQLRLGAGAFPPLVWLEQWIAEEGLTPDTAAAVATQRLALTKLMMANSITSLRGIAQRDWRSFVERQSVMEHVLRADPAGFYGQMTFATRDQYRHVVERIAKRTGQSEEAVAQRAIDFARAGEADTQDLLHASRRSHVGYYLVDRGIAELEASVGYRPTLGESRHRWVLRHPNVVFVGGIVVGTLATLATIAWLAGDLVREAWLAVLLFALIPANDVAVQVVNQLITTFLRPHVLPKLDLHEHGVPAEYRTAVVVPTLFDSVDTVHEALANLEVQFLANREAHLHFAILSDFTDSATETRDHDAAIVAAAEEGVRALNARYAPNEQDAFYLFHRPRRWNSRQGAWMGWERKRGKLADFNRFVRGGAHDAFTVVTGNVDAIRRVRYVITLDADTVLPPDAAPALVGALAHPLNRAIYDAQRARVVEGYGILQPRVGVSLASAHRSRFAALHSGHPGVDPYTTAVSDVYQDLYGEGSFTGKGIYDVDAFEQATHGRFPENTLLSHDLIEGNYARAGLATDINVYDDYPATYLAFSRRKHRWIRGDWQLLQWLTARVPGPDGPEQNRLSLLSRWKILDNLRRSVVEIAQLAWLVAGWTLLPGSPLWWTALGIGASAAPWITSLLLAVVRPPRDKSWRAYYAAVGQDAITSAQQLALAITFLPQQAWLSADAIVRTLWRLFVTKRSLLEWRSAQLVERATRVTPGRMWRAMWPAVAATVAIAGVVGGVVPNDAPAWQLALAILPITAVWALSPILAYALSRPAARTPQTFSASARKAALRYAQLHWKYFDHFVTAESNWLAPDNFQEVPTPVTAMRTSPTNIGLQLLSTVTAHDLGFITLEDMTQRLERAFRSLDRMQRFRGHFHNWYDLHDLRVLEPAYISTVDSGNLAGHLLALRQACLDFQRDVGALSGDLAERLYGLAEHAQRYAMEMDFRLLFDASRKLFAIGYHTGSHTLDGSYYDLLASEARLASFVAVAKNDVPFEHWFRLGRTLTYTAGEIALISWSGSMFEYLMPLLVMHSFPFTLLGDTYLAAVRRHIAYGEEHGVPWGNSESAYNVRDHHLTYQYRAFGVPDLGLKRGLGHDLVVAPYASALAAMIDPEQALANLQTLERKGALGAYGFHDALDYSRPDAGRRYAIVHNYMAHHIGMSLVSLGNAILGPRWHDRFHRDPMVRAAALLLDERVPRRLALHETQPIRPDEGLSVLEEARPVVREFDTADTKQPHVAFLGHAPYTVMVSNAGAGYSRYEELAVTRWRADGTRDNTGQFCYVKDVERGRTWSAAHQPVCAPADWYRALLATDGVTLHRFDGDIETRIEVVVVPDDSAEVRRVTLTNESEETRDVELTSYGEIVLAPPDADRAHPAFGNLFIETAWHEWCTAITATRRPRSAAERPLWCVHVVDTGVERVGQTTYETDRARFIGRGRTTRDPIALEQDGPLLGDAGAVLDPIFALRVRVRLAPGRSASVAFTTLVAATAERAFELADRYHHPNGAQRALDLAWTSAHIELRELGISPADAAVFQELAGYLLYALPGLRPPSSELLRNTGSQDLLWATGISGDWPILLATIESMDGLPTLQQLFLAHRYWRRRGLTVDLVVINAQDHSYQQELNDRITEIMLASSGSGMVDGPGAVFVRRRDQMGADALRMISATARVHIPCDGRPLARIVSVARATPDSDAAENEFDAPFTRRAERSTPESTSVVQRFRSRAARAIAMPIKAVTRSLRQDSDASAADRIHNDESLLFDNGIGGLTTDNDYRIHVHGDRIPPAPWANIIANPHGGFVVTERGGGFAWAENSYFFRLTPWHNDPVSDPVSDVIYLRDEETGEIWTATPAPTRNSTPYSIDHRPGTSSFTHEHNGIAAHLTLGLVPDGAVKVSHLRLTNRLERSRRISVIAYVEWALGVQREHTQHQVRTTFDAKRGTIFARNCFNPQFADLVAFCSVSARVSGYTGDRGEFIGRNGTLADPAGLGQAALSGVTGAGIDPCAALQSVVELAPGAAQELVVLLGAAPDQERAMQAVDEYRHVDRAVQAIAETVHEWSQRLSVITVRTPEPSFDAMINRWSLYQALACRMWARSAIYQSGGAYGFRDQLQDAMAFVYAEPAIAREHIMRTAARQFVEGDVQHWWHAESGRGVRTRFSDDLVWLPYVVDHYVRVTGDTSVLDECAPFLTMRQLEPNEHEIYDLPQVSSETASVYEHCRRALQRACTVGSHGLPLIGGGDWNDGMNRVGIQGRGESVWLAWFLTAVLRQFAHYADAHGDGASASEFRAHADAYAAAIEAHAWDGAWYRRAYFDDGTPLGSAANAECRIDSIAQSWSVISGAGNPERQDTAMRSLHEYLVLQEARLVKLLTPPFDTSPQDPGYIKGYVPGVRENGAQYTHAALWTVLATALRGDGDRAFALYQMLNPLTHTATPEGMSTYKVEPYVVAADVYTTMRELGRGGWTWYTGSASWMYRVGLEAMLGLTKRGATLRIDPCLPEVWPQVTIEYRYGAAVYTIIVHTPAGVRRNGADVTIDGRPIAGDVISLVDDGVRHEVLVKPRHHPAR